MVSFDLIKGRLARFSRATLIKQCLDCLSDIEASEKKHFAIWNILVLFKWILIYSKDSVFLLKATKADFVDTLDLVEKFESDSKPVDFKKGVIRGLKILAFQQFWTQDEVTGYCFAKQSLLYLRLNQSKKIARDFSTKAGLTIDEFLKLCYVTNLYLNLDKVNRNRNYTGILDLDYFELMLTYFKRDTIKKFHELLTLQSRDLEKIQRMKNEKYQLYETSFWSSKPFFLFESNLRILHRAIFGESVRHFIYDFLKGCSSHFSEEFGNSMERYIELGLVEIKAKYLKESQLKMQFKEKSKTVDFLVEDNILIESKAIELHPRSGIIRSEKMLFNEFEDSIVKSYKQMLMTATRQNLNQKWFGLVITFKETYCGFGLDAWDEFLKEPVTKFAEENHLDLNVLPPECVCFISLRDWDWVVQTVKDKRVSIHEVIQTCIRQNAKTNINEKVILFDQALRVNFPVKNLSLSYLQSETTELRI